MNFSHLQVFIESIKFQPHLIVCTESWNLKYYKYFSIEGYQIFCNNSTINATDGVVIYVRDDLPVEESKIVNIQNVSFLSITTALNGNDSFTFTALYRCHDVSQENFSDAVKIFLKKSSQIKNHHI